jgi:hypothetical protein
MTDLNLDFTNAVETENSKNKVIRPGTITLFTIESAEVTTSQGGTPQLHCKFTSEEGDFQTWFVLKGKDAGTTDKVLARVKTLLKAYLNVDVTGQIDGQTFMKYVTALVGSKAYMRIKGKLNEEKGVVYPDLPYFAFASSDKDALTWGTKELLEIKELQERFDNYKPKKDGEEAAAASTENNLF